MKKNLVMMSIILAAIAQSAFANGVEKILPSDAKNVKIKSVELDQVLINSVTTGWNNDGPTYENTYGPALAVAVTYDSKSGEDVPQRTDGDTNATYDPTPTIYLELSISDAEAAAIKAKKLDVNTLVSMSVTEKQVQFDNPVYTDACRFSNDGGPAENESTCVKHETITESRPVLTVNNK